MNPETNMKLRHLIFFITANQYMIAISYYSEYLLKEFLNQMRITFDSEYTDNHKNQTKKAR